MTILTAKQTWKREPNPRGYKSRAELNRLTPTEEERVRRAMWVLHVRFGNWSGVSRALGYHRVTVERVLNIRKTASLAFASRVSKKLGVSLGDVLSGSWPKAGECPMCGCCDEKRPTRPSLEGAGSRVCRQSARLRL